MKSHNDQEISYIVKHLILSALQFQGKPDSVQVYLVLERELRVLHLDLETAEDCPTKPSMSI